MSIVQKDEKAKKLSINETLLLAQIHSLQIKNINLELRLLRMEKHLEQIMHHTNFPASNLAWGPQALISILYLLISEMFKNYANSLSNRHTSNWLIN
jgi:hypothetical protein